MIKISKLLIDAVSRYENVSATDIKSGIAAGHIVVPKNRKRNLSSPRAIGKGLTVKVNANIGLSSAASNISREMEKLEAAVSAGADAVMDLSTGHLQDKVRKKVLAVSPVPVGTVPVYDLACRGAKNFNSMKENDFLDVLRKQAEEGVDFFTIHSGLTLEAVEIAKKKARQMGIVSRGGALLASWMIQNREENPYYSRFDEIIKIAKEHDITLSLGDSLRPGAISDATDQLQVQELLVLGQLQKRAFDAGVQVMIEGPGHVPMDQIEANVKLQKSICNGAPFYVLGPLVTDSAPGYDHITGAIGGAIAAWCGADFLCYVTPAEHLGLPDIDDVRNGVIASKIAAHAADIARGLPLAIKRDRMISDARAKRLWREQFEFAIDPVRPKKVHSRVYAKSEDVCTMCAEYCSMKIMEKALGDR